MTAKRSEPAHSNRPRNETHSVHGTERHPHSAETIFQGSTRLAFMILPFFRPPSPHLQAQHTGVVTMSIWPPTSRRIIFRQPPQKLRFVKNGLTATISSANPGRSTTNFTLSPPTLPSFVASTLFTLHSFLSPIYDVEHGTPTLALPRRYLTSSLRTDIRINGVSVSNDLTSILSLQY